MDADAWYAVEPFEQHLGQLPFVVAEQSSFGQALQGTPRTGDPVQVQCTRLVAVGPELGVFLRLGLASCTALLERLNIVIRRQVTNADTCWA